MLASPPASPPPFIFVVAGACVGAVPEPLPPPPPPPFFRLLLTFLFFCYPTDIEHNTRVTTTKQRRRVQGSAGYETTRHNSPLDYPVTWQLAQNLSNTTGQRTTRTPTATANNTDNNADANAHRQQRQKKNKFTLDDSLDLQTGCVAPSWHLQNRSGTPYSEKRRRQISQYITFSLFSGHVPIYVAPTLFCFLAVPPEPVPCRAAPVFACCICCAGRAMKDKKRRRICHQSFDNMHFKYDGYEVFHVFSSVGCDMR